VSRRTARGKRGRIPLFPLPRRRQPCRRRLGCNSGNRNSDNGRGGGFAYHPPPSAVPIAWKNCVEPDVPDSITGATSRNDAISARTARTFAMTPSSICSSCGNPPHEGFAKAHGIRAIRSPGGREEGNLQTCRRLRATRAHVGSRPAAPRRCKCTKVVHRAHVFEILTMTSSVRAFV